MTMPFNSAGPAWPWEKFFSKPVNVIDGNYKLMAGVCPWWDGVARGEAAE